MPTVSYNEIVTSPLSSVNRYWNIPATFRAIWGEEPIPITVEALEAGIPPRNGKYNSGNLAYKVDTFGDRFNFDLLADFVVPSSRVAAFKATVEASHAAHLAFCRDAWARHDASMKERFETDPEFMAWREGEYARYYREIHGSYDDHRRNVVAAIVANAEDVDPDPVDPDPIDPVEPGPQSLRPVLPFRSIRIRR